MSAAAPPRHVAVIMDGNGRWALQRGLSRREGHRRGLDAARKTLRACAAHKIPYLSLFAFSSENWSRPEEEVSALMMLFADSAKSLVGELRDNGVRVRFIGQRERFSPMLRQAMESMEAATDGGRRLHVNVAVSYSGRWDVAQAAEQIARDGGDFGEKNFAKRLSTGDLPEVDLLIRSGGERRLSNFMLWQAAYAELHFTPVLWPDFGEDDFEKALADYGQRERRFGDIAC